MSDKSWGWRLTGIVLALAVVPYLYAWASAGPERVFTGILYAPKDGYSYIAKMWEGWAGAWRFTLPYTARPGQGAYLFLYHLALGHLARWLHLPLIWVYHAARLAGDVALVWALGRFFGALFPKDAIPRRWAWAVSLLALGMGWVLLPVYPHPIDFWVTEAYPFLTVLTNAHFPWALACMVWLLTPSRVSWWDALAALALGVISPFGVVVVWTVWGAWTAWQYTRRGRIARMWWQRWVVVTVAGWLYPLYAYWAILHDPVLAQWNAQNVTATPPFWVILAGFSPWVVVGGMEVFRRLRQRGPAEDEVLPPGEMPAWQMLAWWGGLTLLLAFVPWPLQRRFLIGGLVPWAGLAALWAARRPHLRRDTVRLFSLTLPAVVFVLLVPVFGNMMHEGLFYMSKGEAQAMQWLATNTPPDAVVLAAPDTGRIIPAFSGRRVLFGHEMETVEAVRYRELTGDFFRRCFQGQQAWDFLRREGVDYIFLGPRERALGGLPIYLPPESVVARFGDVVIYRVPPNP